MYHFFAAPEQIEETCIHILGADVNHIKNVLRMRIGEQVSISDGENPCEYICEIAELFDDEVTLNILEKAETDTELPAQVWLFQGLPKADKMELIIQKSVELGVHCVVPVTTRRCVVKLDPKKEDSRIRRWQQIAEAAAKQSGRRIIPEVSHVMSWKEALRTAAEMDLALIPYELAGNMEETRQILARLVPGQRCAVFIGPEGGFEKAEVEQAMEQGIHPVTLGKRILRTETAGPAILAWFGYLLER